MRPEIVHRDAWRARDPRSVTYIRTPAPETWIHHTGTKFTGRDRAEEARRMRAIQAFHMDDRGFSDIAYSWVIFPSGRIYQGRRWGRYGAHTYGHNSISHGICFAGNFMRQRPTKAALESCRWLIDQGIERRKIAGPRRKQPTGGHRDVGQTACPGNSLYRQIPELRRHFS